MSDREAGGSSSRGDRAERNGEASSSSARREHSSRQGRDEHRDRSKHSHRDRDRDRDRHRHSSSRRDAKDVESLGSRRHRADTDDKHRSKRHHDDRRDRPHRDDDHRSSRRHHGRDERESHHNSSRRDEESLRRSQSPNPTASTSARVSPSRSPAVREEAEGVDEDAPNFAPSGLLAAESNTVNGVALKYHEPPEARKPKSPWRLYCFKDGKEQQVLHLASQSAYLLGRDRTVVDIPLDHESCSNQHAVLQFRQTITTNEFGDRKKRIQPFLIDLESSNGSYVNDKEIPTSRYYQLRTGDTLTFGASTREYVLLDESSL